MSDLIKVIAIIVLIVATMAINHTIGLIFFFIELIFIAGAGVFGVDPFNVWPSLPKSKEEQPSTIADLYKKYCGKTISLHDAAKSGLLGGEEGSTKLYVEKVVVAREEEAAKKGLVVGAVIGMTFTTLAIGAGYGIYKYTRRNKNGKN